MSSGEGPHARTSRAQPAESAPQQQASGSHSAEAGSSSATSPQHAEGSARRYPPRTCRICLETINPTYQEPSSSIPGITNPTPSVSYISSDPGAGRLIRPCMCKGSSRFVHEGCLQQWRHADPAYGRRNYWQCPTCGFRYRLGRMRWANWISSKGMSGLGASSFVDGIADERDASATQVTLTVSILLLAMFLLGFVADPIINLYLDPYSTLSSVPLPTRSGKVEPLFPDDEPAGWIEHFIKGLASLGLLSFVKVLFAMSPWQWWNLRSSGLMGGSGRHAGGSGRDRLASISWIVVLIGVGTFLWVRAADISASAITV